MLFEWTFARAVIGNRLLQAGFQRLCESNLNRNVHDPALRERLRPDYRAGCKRLLMSSSFYPAIQRPNAELVDAAIDHVEPAGIVTTDSRLHLLDVLILATGFHAHDYMAPMQVVGPGGATLADAWSDGPSAYRTVAMNGFPNFFMLIGPGSPVGNYSLIAVAEAQADYIMQFVRRLADGAIETLQPSAAATTRFNAAFRRAMRGTVWLTGCSNWYLARNGIPDVWPWTIGRFRREMRRPAFEDYEITHPTRTS
jgi:cation diffusion facilitator CzcD-associated flavoprotein CzcO